MPFSAPSLVAWHDWRRRGGPGKLRSESWAPHRRSAAENAGQAPTPELHRGLLLRVIAVAVVDAGDVFLLGVIEDSADDESRDAAASHQTRGGSTEIMSANVRPITGCALRPDPGDVGARTLRETSPHVFVVTP